MSFYKFLALVWVCIARFYFACNPIGASQLITYSINEIEKSDNNPYDYVVSAYELLKSCSVCESTYFVSLVVSDLSINVQIDAIGQFTIALGYIGGCTD
jgi:hypothetical protein